MPTGQGDPVPARSLDLASASAANIRSSADAQTVAATSQSGKRRPHRLRIPGDDNPPPWKLFPDDSARRTDLTADLPIVFGPFLALSPTPSCKTASLHGTLPLLAWTLLEMSAVLWFLTWFAVSIYLGVPFALPGLAGRSAICCHAKCATLSSTFQAS